jgi:hypothetical protein
MTKKHNSFQSTRGICGLPLKRARQQKNIPLEKQFFLILKAVGKTELFN